MSAPPPPDNAQKGMEVNSAHQLFGALAPAAAVGVILLAAFYVLHRFFPEVYDPKRRRLHKMKQAGVKSRPVRGWPAGWEDRALGKEPPDPPSNPVSWMFALWEMSDVEIISYVGADAYMYLRFLRLGFYVSSVAALLGFIILLPINIQGGNGMNKLEHLSMSNIKDRAPGLWAHFAIAYVLTLFVLSSLYHEYKTHIDLRQRYLKSPTAQSYSILLRDIPKNLSDATIQSYLIEILGEDVLAIHPINPKRQAKYEELGKKKDDAIVRLTRALERRKKTGQRPRHCQPLRIPVTGWMLWTPFGAYVDTIDTIEEDIRHYNQELAMLQEQQMTEGGPASAAICTLDSVRVATAFKTIPFQQDIRYLMVSEAPAPEDILWRNLTSSSSARLARTLLVWIGVIALILGYAIPVGFVASLANLTALSHTKGLEWLQPVVNLSPTLTSLIQGFLPPLILSLFFSLVPEIMRLLSRQQMLPSESDCETSAVFKVFLFSLLDVFLAYTIAGAFLSKLQQLTHLAGHPADLVDLIATSLPAQSTFFITYIMIGTLSGLPSEVLRLFPLLLLKIRKKVLMPVRGLWDDLQLYTSEIGFHNLYGFPLVVFLALITYAIVAPLITVFALIYFSLAYPIWLHQLVYVYQPTSHTGGSQWPVVFSCCISALVFQQVLLIGVLGLKGQAIPSALLAPLLLFTVAFGVYLRKASRRVSEVATLESLVYTDISELGPKAMQGLKDAYCPLLDHGRCGGNAMREGGGGGGGGEGEELSHKLLKTLTEPFGVLTQGIFSEGQREVVEITNLIQRGDEESKIEGLVNRGDESGWSFLGPPPHVSTRGAGPGDLPYTYGTYRHQEHYSGVMEEAEGGRGREGGVHVGGAGPGTKGCRNGGQEAFGEGGGSGRGLPHLRIGGGEDDEEVALLQ